MTALAIAALSCVIWIYLLAARGGFWRAAQRDEGWMTPPAGRIVWPRVVAVVPARDEASIIGESIRSLLQQDYRGSFAVIVVDDHSSDDTATMARRAAIAAGAPDRLTVLTAPGLPEGWTGKLWAMQHGISHAQASAEPPDYLLLTDADIRHADDTLTELVERAVGERLALISLLASLRCVSLAERAFVPAFVFFFQLLYPFAWVNRADRTTAAAAGGCMLVACRPLQAAGGIEAIRGELIDDCALARLLKPHGRIWLGLSRRVRSARPYRSVGDIRRMIIRCAYAQLRFSPWWLTLATAGMIVTYLAPPFLALMGSGAGRLLGALAWAQMALALQPTLRFYGVSPLWGLALPPIAAAYLVFTLDSAFQHLRGRGGEWKGRVHRGTSSHEIAGHGN
jgi:hopene-associated glycosyltransferase HpnB